MRGSISSRRSFFALSRRFQLSFRFQFLLFKYQWTIDLEILEILNATTSIKLPFRSIDRQLLSMSV